MVFKIDDERIKANAKIEMETTRRLGNANSDAVENVLRLMHWLRGPKGCPWDKKQTLDTLQKYVVEEAMETVEAAEALGRAGDNPPEHLIRNHLSELGDLLLQVLLQAQLQSEAGHFNFDDVCEHLYQKLLFRHPHLFDPTVPELGWEELKQLEKHRHPIPATDAKSSILDDVPKSLPTLLRAYRLGERAQSFGFCWPDHTGALSKVHEEIEELEGAIASGISRDIQDEMGDALYALINVCRHMHIDPEQALKGTIAKFEHRFRYMEARVDKSSGTSNVSLAKMEALWQEAKRH